MVHTFTFWNCWNCNIYEGGSVSNLVHMLKEGDREICIAADKVLFLYMNPIIFLEGKTAKEIHERIVPTLGNLCPFYETVRLWINDYFKGFEENHFREGIGNLAKHWVKCVETLRVCKRPSTSRRAPQPFDDGSQRDLGNIGAMACWMADNRAL